MIPGPFPSDHPYFNACLSSSCYTLQSINTRPGGFSLINRKNRQKMNRLKFAASDIYGLEDYSLGFYSDNLR